MANVELVTLSARDREAALERWRHQHDVSEHDAAVAQAAGMARVIVGADGPSFDPVSFGDLVAFIEELPF